MPEIGNLGFVKRQFSWNGIASYRSMLNKARNIKVSGHKRRCHSD